MSVKTYVTYQVTQNLDWCCPKMLVYVDNEGYITGGRYNPDNGLTEWYADEEKYGLVKFEPESYKDCIKLD